MNNENRKDKMIKGYKTISRPGRAEIFIEKSRFIGYSAPVSSEEEAISFINSIKKEHRDATHNVSAYVLGTGNEMQRFNDDGEPAGTAGMPILEVIKKEDLRNIVIVVTRYFGGIKLGGGGLIRAYTKGAKIAIEAGQVINKMPHVLLQIVIDYSLLGKVQNELQVKGYSIKEIKYSDQVELFVYIPISASNSIEKQLNNITNGQQKVIEKGREFLTIGY